MGLSIKSARNSFVEFGDQVEDHCIWGPQSTCLPLLFDSDVQFQFVVEADTVEEADALCQFNSSGIRIGLVTDCLQDDFDVEFTNQPERYRISDLQVLYNWGHGLPGAIAFYDVNDCFRIRLIVGEGESEIVECSNCFQRIDNSCFSSVIEYSNDENAFGFNYCGAGAIDTGGDTGTCEPTQISFLNKETLSIPYTTSLQSLYGPVPTVQVWIYDETGALVNANIVASFNAMPPTLISFDFGGLASGIIIIR